MAGEEPASTDAVFRLCSTDDVVQFIKTQVCEKDAGSVDLALISILLGFIEHRLTVGINGGPDTFPIVSSNEIIPLVKDFRRYICKEVVPKTTATESGAVYTERQTIKDVASAIWKHLSKSFYKDKPHYQTLYTFKKGGHLDCFGLAYAVVAACQVLGCKDVHLSLSEDHAWIVFGPDCAETAEVTWQGKPKEMYRGEPIDNGLLSRNNWLYLGGKPVICDSRRIEASAAAAMINSFIDTKGNSGILSRLQRDLLWVLYDAGCYARYPMALCVLAELQETCPASGRPDADELYYEAIDCSRSHYGDNHVYPYSQYGSYLYRKQLYDLALFRWQQAANALRKYRYNREEEELQKEVKEITHNLIPNAFKLVVESGNASFFESADNFINLLLFYDGICEWEQNGTMSVFHSFWAKSLTQSASYFPVATRLAVLSAPEGAATSPSAVVASSLPRSPVKNIEAYHQSLMTTVVNVYGTGGRESNATRKSVDDFVATCENTKLKADLVWNPEVVSPSKAEKPVCRKLQLRGRKMDSLRKALTKNPVRVADIDLILCAQIEPVSDATRNGTNPRASKRKRIG